MNMIEMQHGMMSMLHFLMQIIQKNANSDENDTLVEKYKIRAVPTLIKEDNGVEIGRHVGIMTEEQLKHWCND